MKDIKLDKDDQLTLINKLEGGGIASKEITARWKKAIVAYKKAQEDGLQSKEVFDVSDKVH